MGMTIAVMPGHFVGVGDILRRNPVDRIFQVLNHTRFVLDGGQASGAAHDAGIERTIFNAGATDEAVQVIGDVLDIDAGVQVHRDGGEVKYRGGHLLLLLR